MDNLPELPQEETEYLDANYLERWEIIPSDGAKFGVKIAEFSIPPGYTPEKSDLLIIIPQGYPGVNLDMFYFSPSLTKTNGQDINALQMAAHFGRSWQQWSRHYTWNPDEDNLIRHIELVKNCLQTEAGA